MKQPENISAFGQEDPTDNRKLGDWESKYSDPKAKKEIRGEATYLGVLLVVTPLMMLILWLESPKHWLNLSDQKYNAILKYGLAWAAGTFGGTLFDLKWLYHSVARQLWHQDRRLWRVFTPHISGGLAFASLPSSRLALSDYSTPKQWGAIQSRRTRVSGRLLFR